MVSIVSYFISMVNVKANFRSRYVNKLLCPLCEGSVDDQQHVLECGELLKKLKTEEVAVGQSVYSDIFAGVCKQKAIINLFERLLEIRSSLVDENLEKINDPSISVQMLRNSDNLQDCTVHYSFGK